MALASWRCLERFHCAVPRDSVSATGGPVRDRLLLLGDTHEVHAAIHVDGISGYRTRQVAHQKHGDVSDLLLGHISAEGRRLLGQIAEFADALHCTARE